MNLFTELSLLARIAYYSAALRSIHPLHVDVPAIVLHIAELREQLERIRGVLA